MPKLYVMNGSNEEIGNVANSSTKRAVMNEEIGNVANS